MAAITFKGEELIAKKQAAKEVMEIDQIVLANIPGLDPTKPVDRNEQLPSADKISLQAPVSQSGYINPNLVVYSLMLTTGGKAFDFNWIGLYSSKSKVVIAISYLPVQTKSPQVAMTRNFMIEYSGAKETGDIKIDAKSWQVDFSARMNGIDERGRVLREDTFGRQLFYGDTCKVTKDSGSYYNVASGSVGMVAGIKFSFTGKRILIQSFPNKVWLDVSHKGNSLSDIQSVVKVIVSNEDRSDYIDKHGVKHFLVKISNILQNQSVVDTRIKNAGAHSAVTHASFNDAMSDTNHERLFIKVADRGGAEYIKKFNTVNTPIGGFKDAGNNIWGLKIDGVVNLFWLGAYGDYKTDDTNAFINALKLCELLNVPLKVDHGVFRLSKSFDLPPNIIINGSGSLKVAHFPQHCKEKDKLRPSYKHKLSGSVFIFSEVDKTYTTKRSDRYKSLSYCVAYKHSSGFSLKNLSFVLDVDVRDDKGKLTTKANDNSANADAIFINNATLCNIDDVTIFGYPKHAAYVVHNEDSSDTFDADYNNVTNSLISGSVAIIGHDKKAGASREGLTGNRFTSTGIYGGDHHHRPSGDYTRGAIFIDGYMGDSDQAGIRGHTFTTCNIRTYANESIVTENCNDIAFIGNTYEFPTLEGIPGANTQGGFKGTKGTRRFRAVCGAATDANKFFTYIKDITGPFQVIGAGGYDQAMFGANGSFVRIGSGDSRPFIQFWNDPKTQANGWMIKWDDKIDQLQFKYANQNRMVLNKNGGIGKGFGSDWGSSKKLYKNVLSLGESSGYGMLPETGKTDELHSIDNGVFDGQIVVLSNRISSNTITVKSKKSGNIRLSGGDCVLDNGFDRLMLQFEKNYWVELSRSIHK